jgi:predicted transcriptional regulator
MKEQIEIESLDLRFEHHRLKSPGAEKVLLASILESGIRDPLQGVNKEGSRILLNGFKRYRCAKKLNIGIVPYMSLGNDEAYGIIELLRISNTKSFSILEQAILIDELNSIYKMCNSDIAAILEKSKSWVSVRMGIIRQMSALVREKVFNGEFPVYSYMYTVRQFMRINSIKKEEIDQFVSAVSGKGLSLRDIDIMVEIVDGSADAQHQAGLGRRKLC